MGKTYPPDATFPALFSAWLAGDPRRRIQLEGLGLRPALMARIAEGECPDKILFMHALKIERVTGLEIQQLLFLQAKRELWGANDRLPEARTYADLTRFLGEVARERGRLAVARKLRLSDLHRIRKWCTGSARMNSKMMQRALAVIEAHRHGKWDTVKAEPLLPEAMALKAASGRDPRHCSTRVIAARLQCAQETVQGWFSGRRNPSAAMRAKIRRTFPELFGGDAKPAMVRTAPVALETPPRADDRDRRVVRSIITILSVAQDLTDSVANRGGTILDGDRLAILKAVEALVRCAGIDRAALRRFRGGGTPQFINPTILDVLGLRGPARRDRR